MYNQSYLSFLSLRQEMFEDAPLMSIAKILYDDKLHSPDCNAVGIERAIITLYLHMQIFG